VTHVPFAHTNRLPFDAGRNTHREPA
jgi:hypothetical protein